MSILDKLGDVLGETASSEFEVTKFLTTGFEPLNRIISGNYQDGMPWGRVIEMFGPSMCGKTAISTLVMAECIKEGGFAMFLDHERSFDISLARDLGLDDASGRFVHLKPKTLEESFMRALNTAQKIRDKELIEPEAPIVVVLDSLAAAVPASKASKELDEMTMADSLALAKATSTVLPVVKMRAEDFNMMFILLNQLRENPTGYGDAERTPGGRAPAFYADVRIKLRHKQKKDASKSRIGQTITAECIKTKLTAPFQKCEWDFLFREDGSGEFDIIGGLIDEAKNIGVLTAKGAYISYKGKSYHRGPLKEHHG